MQLLKANTAVDVLIGPFVDSTDGNTTEDALTLSQADIKLSKNGQALAQKADITAALFDDDGYYNCELDATDTNTEGALVLIVHEAGALPVRHEYMVLAEAAYDSMFTAKDTGYMDVNVKAVSEDTVAADNLESACDNYSVTRGLSGTALPAVAADGVGGLPISDAGGLDLDAILADTNELQADWVNGGRLDLILDIIAADTTTDIPALIAALNDISAAEVNAEVDTAIETYHLDHLLAVDYDPAAKPGSATALLNELIESDAGVSRFTENALEQAPAGTGASAATIADAVWEEAQADHVGAGTFGITASEIADILADTNELQTDDIPTSLSGIETKVDTIDGIVDTILVDTGTTLDALIKDIPTTAEFELRTLLAADYTVVGDLGTVQSGDSFAIVNGDHGLVSIQDDVDAILVDTGTTLDTLIQDIPTVAEFEARTIPSADYVVVGDTLARVTLVDTVTDNTDLVTAAAIKTAMEAAGSDLDYLIKALVNKRVWEEAAPNPGELEMFNDADVSLGKIAAHVSSDGTYTTAKRAVI